MFKIVLVLSFFAFDNVFGSNGNATWILTEIREDSRGKMHHFRLENFKDDIACRGCKHSKTTQLDARNTIENVFRILGVLQNETDARLIVETFKEVVNFVYCRNSSTACVNYKESTNQAFQEQMLQIDKHFKHIHIVNNILAQSQNLFDDITEVTVCEISKYDCKGFSKDSYNATSIVKNALESLYVGDTEKLTDLSLDIIHNQVVRARCSLECNPF